MELWFLLAIGSALTSGIGSFTHKVAAEKNHDIAVLSVYASLISAFILLCCTLYFAGLSHFWEFSTIIALVASITTLATLILKIKSLRLIDAAIFFPLYKVCGPLLTVLLGIVAFRETFTVLEWIGLGITLSVPLLLISRSESSRQKNLLLGLQILILASITAAISTGLSKYGTGITNNLWLFLFISEVFTVGSAFLLLLQKHRTATFTFFKTESSPAALWLVLVMGVTQSLGFMTIMFAFASGGTLAIVYTISSLYILVPIILSILVYKEHWNVRKAVALALSIAALALLR
jgi:drug/metabolite transporter (DMT)-like permease